MIPETVIIEVSVKRFFLLFCPGYYIKVITKP